MNNPLPAILNFISGNRASQVKGYTDTPPAPAVGEIAAGWRDPYAQDVLMNFLTGNGQNSSGIFLNPSPVIRYNHPQAGLGYHYPLGIFREMRAKDARIWTSLMQRKALTLAASMRIVPDGEDSDAQLGADLLRTALFNLQGGGYQAWADGMLDGVGDGVAFSEGLWAADDFELRKADGSRGVRRKWAWVRRFCHRDPRRFVFDFNSCPRLLTLGNMSIGEEVPANQFFVFRPYPLFDNPYGDPVLAKCVWPYYLKKLGLKWKADLCEKLARPWLIGEIDRQMSPGERDKWIDGLNGLPEGLGMVPPWGGKVTALEAGKSGSEILETYIDRWDSYNAGTIAGQDFTVSQAEKGGTRSAGEIYEEVASRIAQQDAAAWARFIEIEYGRRLIDYNFGYQGVPYPRVVIDPSTSADKMNQIIVATGLSQIGFHLSRQDLEDKTGYQWAVDDNDWVRPEVPAALGPDGQPLDARPPYDKTQNPAGASNTGGLKKSAAQAQNP